MNYEFRPDLDRETYLAFAEGLAHCNFMQTPMWGQVKPGWQMKLCGLFADGKMVGGSLLLVRSLFLGQKIVYAPRGFLLDYEDAEQVACFTQGVKDYAKQLGAYMVRIDPEILYSVTYKGEKSPVESGNVALELLEGLGYRHMGFATDFQTYTQPRFNAEYALFQGDVPKTDEQMLGEFDKKLRKFIGKYTESRGISFFHGNADEDISRFAALCQHTEERQHILLRDAAYFTRMRDAFGDRCMFFFARMDLDAFAKFLDAQPQDEQTEKDRAEVARLRQQGNEVPMSGLCMLHSGDTAYLLYSGFDDSVFPRFRTTNQIRWEAMRYFRDLGCRTFSFMGIHGDLDDSLSEFKLKFNPHIVEYLGEVELPVKPYIYKFMRKFVPFAKRVYINIALFLKGKK